MRAYTELKQFPVADALCPTDSFKPRETKPHIVAQTCVLLLCSSFSRVAEI